ncbi:uncharacterized protein LOC121378519 [Gigantopelta aegis]|uniref:uncharacterized protein LOC121378519 n=1 Tax=Gigantopelta aegis TaxID=1735272 RepID=UPI001B88B69F|nr:uncharacterized protein LOC121378519 [Gigantopelta aegis]
MPRWSQTPIIYKIGTIGIVVSFVIFVVGFGTPVWYRVSLTTDGVLEAGLWQACNEGFSNCNYIEQHAAVVVRGMEIAACAFHLSAVINAFIGFFSSNANPLSIVISAILAGVFGIVGEILYATWGIDNQIISGSGNKLSWSFALAVVGSGLVTIFSIAAVVASCYFHDPGKEDSELSDLAMREMPRHQMEPNHQYQHSQLQKSQYQQPHQHGYSGGDKMPMQDIPRYQPGYRSQYKSGYEPDHYQYYSGNQRKMYQSSQRYDYDQRY